MTVASWVIGIAIALVSAAAARRVALAKGRPAGNWGAFGFFGGIFGLLGAAFVQPADGKDRLAWWSDAPVARTWAKLATLTFIVGAAVIAVLIWREVSKPATYDGTALDKPISTWLTQHGVTGAVVSCPATYPGKRGYTFFCDVTGSTDVPQMRVTVDDANGSVEWIPAG